MRASMWCSQTPVTKSNEVLHPQTSQKNSNCFGLVAGEPRCAFVDEFAVWRAAIGRIDRTAAEPDEAWPSPGHATPPFLLCGPISPDLLTDCNFPQSGHLASPGICPDGTALFLGGDVAIRASQAGCRVGLGLAVETDGGVGLMGGLPPVAAVGDVEGGFPSPVQATPPFLVWALITLDLPTACRRPQSGQVARTWANPLGPDPTDPVCFDRLPSAGGTALKGRSNASCGCRTPHRRTQVVPATAVGTRGMPSGLD